MKSPEVLTCDLAIIGGGLAGVCAALAAARNGATVILVQDRSVLGGNSSSEVKMHIVGADCHGHRPGTRETGIIEELRLEDACRNPQRSFSLWDLLLYEKVTENPNIRLLLDSHCDGCTTEKQGARVRILEAHVRRHATEEEFILRARFFADCSGDGRLGFEAGADYRMGREAKAEYGESLAQDQADSYTLGNSILFTARRYETPQPFLTPAWARPFRREDFKHRPFHGFDYGYWWAEWGGTLDTIRDLDTIRHELLRIALGIWGYVKNSGDCPESANWALEWVGALPGKRESRRFLGDHVLTQDDCQSGRLFEDQVAYGGWWLDLHPPEGVDAPDEMPCVQHHLDQLFTIPLRALYSRNVENLFFAGRNMSATHVAFASTRVMATCAVMGQAIGTAAALLRSTSRNEAIRDLATSQAVHQIQQTLLRDGAFLPGLQNDEPNDLARTAQIRASSEKEHRTASHVITGPDRSIQSKWGAWAVTADHCWESRELPASLDLTLSKPVAVKEIHLTFCSGLHRELILSPSAFTSAKTLRGAQPEVVRDYVIRLDGKVAVTVQGNYLRKRVHHLPQPLMAQTVQIEVLATNGHPTARIFEVRLY